MARPRSIVREIMPLLHKFAAELAGLVEGHATLRARDAVLRAFGHTGPATNIGYDLDLGPSAVGRGRKRITKGPIQLCPVPGCKNRAAPVFGMVCSQHKELPRARIKKYRDERRRAKAKRAG